VFRGRLLCRGSSHAGGEQAARGTAIEKLAEEVLLGRLERARDRGFDPGANVPLLGDGVDKSEELGFADAFGPPGQHHRHRMDRIDEVGQSNRAAKPRMESEQDLGESEQGVLDRDPIIAGERDFQSATKAIAVNHGDGRQRQTVETIEDAMTADEQCVDPCGIRDPAKFTDICPRMKPPDLPDRMTRPFGLSCSILDNAASNSVSTSSDNVLALAPCLSITSQAIPSSSFRNAQ
jgi:hypothetical protein